MDAACYSKPRCYLCQGRQFALQPGAFSLLQNHLLCGMIEQDQKLECCEQVNTADDTMRAVAAAMGVTKLPYFHMYMHGQLAKNFTANLHKVSYLKRAISDCKQCLHPGCH